MALGKSRRNTDKTKMADGFRISNGPVIRLTEERQLNSSGQVAEVPRIQGPPRLFAIARDRHTIFVYWEIDWPAIFAGSPPVDRQVHLRVLRGERMEGTSTAVEPFAGNYYLTVSHPSAAYRVQIGYYHPEGNWNSVANSEEVIIPADGVSDNQDLDLATIPFHLTFQRLIDLFRASNGNGLAEIISRLESRAVTDDERALLSDEEWEILRAMNLSLDEIRSSRRGFSTGKNEAALRKRAEAILGFGATSPAHGFGSSSW
jgi:hypothetical protein